MRVATHDGTFHADEVFAVAALQLTGGPVEVVRTREPGGLAAADLRVDVGFRHDPAAGDFDHHQRDFAEVRPNGVRFASFGLIWRAYGAAACGGDADVAAAVDETLVQGVDAADVGQTLSEPVIEGVRAMGIGGIVGGFNARWDEALSGREERERFDAAVEFARGVLEREIASVAAGQRAAETVRAAIRAAADPRVVELEANVPFKQVVVQEAPDALFVIYPKRRGFGLEAVPRRLGTFENRLDLPAAWAGLENERFAAVTGVPDVLFCHAKRFLAVARTLEAVRSLAGLALQERERATG